MAPESKEIVCVFRSAPQPGPWSVKTAGGELEQQVAVRDLLRDLLTVVNRDFHDDSGHVGRQPDYVRDAGVMAPAAGISGNNADCELLAELSISAWKLSPAADV